MLLADILGECFDGEVLVVLEMIFLFEDFDGSLIENLIEGEKLFDEFDFLLFAHLLYFWALQSWF